LNIYDLLYHERLIISEAAVQELEQLLGPKKEAATDLHRQLKKRLKLQRRLMSRPRSPSERASPRVKKEAVADAEAATEGEEATEK
jgi:hypothetical protein